MNFISSLDRRAGVAAFVELSRYMETKLPHEVAATPEETRREEAEKAWDSSTEAEREVMLAIWQSTCIPLAYYECHLTFDPAATYGKDGKLIQREHLEELGAKYFFTFSIINGDEVLGKGTRWYLTRSLKDGATLANDMHALTLALEQAGVPIMRRKIEHIVFDDRRWNIAGTARAA